MVELEVYRKYADKISEGMYQYRLDTRNLKRILRYGRPAGNKVEEDFIRRYFLGNKFKDTPGLKMWLDEFDYRRGDLKGNIYIQIGEKKDSETVFSSHTDTVHSSGVIQNVLLCPDDLVFRTDSGQCLGGDDGTGIWIMWELIKAGVKGLYIFHRAEEVGGQGSAHISRLPLFQDGHYKRCIAFDRKADKSIITHQACSRCCSDEFTADLAKKMGMGHKADNTGSFTDSANYTDLIPECTNFSVGYYGAHSARETQDIEYLFPFRDALVNLDWESLITVRKAGDKEYSSYGYYGYGTTKVKPPAKVRKEIDWEDWDDYYWDTQLDEDDDWRSAGVKGDSKDTGRDILDDTNLKDLPLHEDWEEGESGTDEGLEDLFDDWDEYEEFLEKNDPKRIKSKEELSEEEEDDENVIYLDDIDVSDNDYNWISWFTSGIDSKSRLI